MIKIKYFSLLVVVSFHFLFCSAQDFIRMEFLGHDGKDEVFDYPKSEIFIYSTLKNCYLQTHKCAILALSKEQFDFYHKIIYKMTELNMRFSDKKHLFQREKIHRWHFRK